MIPELADAVDLVVHHTGHTRYRHLAETRPEWGPVILGLAEKHAGRPMFRPRYNRSAINDRPRVGLLAPVCFIGGAESWMLSLLRSIEGVDWQGMVVTEGKEATSQAGLERFSEIPIGYGRQDARRLAESCDVLLSWAMPGIGELLEGIGNRPAIIETVHAPVESQWAQIPRTRSPIVTRYVGVSELARPVIPAPPHPTDSVILNAVDPWRMLPTRTRSQVRASWGIADNVPVVGYLGRLSSEKDPQAMARLAEEIPDPWHVVVVGEGPERPAMSMTPGKLHMVGPDTRAGDVLSAFDWLVVPSHYESFGLTIAEGWWAGVPTITTDVGITRMVPGLSRLIPVNADGFTLASAVLTDFAYPDERRRRVKQAQAYARQHLSPERFGREWGDLIRSVVRPPEIPTSPPISPDLYHRISDCPDRECKTGCQLTICRAGKGDQDGGMRTTLTNCERCVELFGITE